MPSSIPAVLVVDDQDINIAVLEEILKDDYRVITARNGKKALEQLETMEDIPKIVLLDVMMPEMSGRQMFEIMRANDAFKRIPVIFITAAYNSESELLAAGAVDFITKPFWPEIVRQRVRNQIELKNYSDNLEKMVAEKTAEAIKTLDNALEGLANVIEHRDIESGGHVRRTQLYMQALCDHLIESNSIYADDLKTLDPDIIMRSMALHDVGKIAIPDRILLKEGKLDDEEYAIMKTHTTRGKEIIGELGDVKSSLYLKHCEDICYGHHERWDGKGYPRQLKETEIPLPARLASLADVYDALVCARVYKPPFPHNEAIQIIANGRGTQFDPVVADSVIHLQNRFKEIAQQYK